MKNIFTTLLVALSCTALVAQSSQHKLGFTVGGGSQKYYGDLGNGFGVDNICWYGVVGSGFSYYVNRSFDAGVTLTVGDYGYHQKSSDAEGVELKDRCPGCLGRLELDNLSSRMTAIGIQARYKFANGYLLNENSLLRPYVFAGVAFNHIVDRMKMDCVDAGNYTALNAGAGLRLYCSDRFHVGYNGTMGYFTTDKIDYKHGGGNDMYLQHSLTIGFDFL